MGKRKANNSPSPALPSTLGSLFNNFFNFKIGNTTIPRQPAKKKSRTNAINNKNTIAKKLTFNNTTNVPNTFKKLLEKNEKNEKARKNKK